MWLLLNSCLPFPDILQAMGFSLPSKCVNCDHADAMLHFFYLCPFAASLWHFFAQQLDKPYRFQSLSLMLQTWWASITRRNCIETFLPSFLVGNFRNLTIPHSTMLASLPWMILSWLFFAISLYKRLLGFVLQLR